MQDFCNPQKFYPQNCKIHYSMKIVALKFLGYMYGIYETKLSDTLST